jgi:hypothetical protein
LIALLIVLADLTMSASIIPTISIDWLGFYEPPAPGPPRAEAAIEMPDSRRP